MAGDWFFMFVHLYKRVAFSCSCSVVARFVPLLIRKSESLGKIFQKNEKRRKYFFSDRGYRYICLMKDNF